MNLFNFLPLAGTKRNLGKFYGHELEAESESSDYEELPSSFSEILINLVNERCLLRELSYDKG